MNNLKTIKNFYNNNKIIEFMMSQNELNSESQKNTWHTFILYNINNKTLDSNLYILYLLKRYNINNKSLVIDWGCGLGKLLSDVYYRYKCKCKGFNIANKQLHIANKLYSKKNSISFHLTDGNTINLTNQSVNFIISQESLCYSISKYKIFKEFYRVLKYDGVLIFQDWFENDKLLSKIANEQYYTNVKSFNIYKKSLLKAGFKNIKIHMPTNPLCCGSKEIGCMSFIVSANK